MVFSFNEAFWYFLQILKFGVCGLVSVRLSRFEIKHTHLVIEMNLLVAIKTHIV